MIKTDIRLPEKLLEKIETEADNIGISKSEYIRAILIWKWYYEDN